MTWVAEADLCAPVIEVDLTRPPENPVCTSPCCSAPPATTEPPAAVGNPILPLSGRKVEVVDLGLSLAGWNAVISLGLALVAFAGLRRAHGSSSVSQ